MDNYLKYIFPKTIILALLLLAVFDKNTCRFSYLILAGIISGIYNGYYNDIQWRAQSPKHKNKKSTPEECLHNSFLDVPYRTHQMFNHILCSLVAAICFYLLLSKINIAEPLITIKELGVGDLILFIFALTGFAGILPRAIWYWSYGPRIKS